MTPKAIFIYLLLLFSPLFLFSREITVAVFDNAPPVSDLNESGDPEGFFPELVSRMLEDLGHTPRLISYSSFSRAFSDAAEGKVMIMTALLDTPEREEIFSFCREPLMVSWSQVYTLADVRITSIFDLEGESIAVMKGDQNAQRFMELMESFDIVFTPVWGDTFKHCINAVEEKKASSLVAFSTFHLFHPELRPTSIVFSPAEAYLATADTGIVPILTDLDSLALRLKEDSSSYYYEILDKWFLAQDSADIPNWLRMFLLFFSFVILASLLLVVVFRRQYNRKKAALYETEAKFQIIADFTYDWEYWLNPQGEMIYCSPSCLRVSGYHADDFKSGALRISDIVLKEDLDIWNTHIHQRYAPDEPQISETVRFRIERKDGEITWIEHVCNPVTGPGGTFLGFRGTNRDITDRIDAQEKALESERLKTRFLANISHELRTPLNGINGMLYLLSEEPLSDNQQHYLKLAEDSVAKLAGMINNILSFTYISQRKHVTDEKLVRISPLLERVAGVIGLDNENTISLRVDPEDLSVFTDETILTLIVSQLLDNANKYSRESIISIRCSLSDDMLVVTISDKGIGIDEKELKNVFSLFYQSEDPYTKTYQGVGLGLSIVQSAVDMLEGSVSVESRVGEGTAVTVQLPAGNLHRLGDAQAGDSEKSMDAILSHEHTATKILLVEDEAINRMYVSKLLEEYECEVLKAEDGEKAVHICFEEKPNLILMDIGLPKMNGIDATKAIRSRTEFKETPIIALTAYSGPDDIKKLLASGINQVMQKPIKQRVLGDLIDQFCKKSRR